jgi:hypothetical protein
LDVSSNRAAFEPVVGAPVNHVGVRCSIMGRRVAAAPGMAVTAKALAMAQVAPGAAAADVRHTAAPRQDDVPCLQVQRGAARAMR